MIENEPKKETSPEFVSESEQEQITELFRKLNRETSTWPELEELAKWRPCLL